MGGTGRGEQAPRVPACELPLLSSRPATLSTVHQCRGLRSFCRDSVLKGPHTCLFSPSSSARPPFLDRTPTTAAGPLGLQILGLGSLPPRSCCRVAFPQNGHALTEPRLAPGVWLHRARCRHFCEPGRMNVFPRSSRVCPALTMLFPPCSLTCEHPHRHGCPLSSVSQLCPQGYS